ncbi:MAG: HAD family hydrolase [Ruminococcus sp.]|nr:HAD family hydrolase [Ruminococcus sp.]
MILAIFDLDGTIADTIADLGDATNYGLRVLGHPEHDYEQYKKMVGNGAPVLCQRALPEGFKHEADRLHELFREYYAEHYLDKTALYDGIKEALYELRDEDVKLTVATNKPQDFARDIVKALLPDVGFEAVLGGTAERPKKPDRAIIDEVLDCCNEGHHFIGRCAPDCVIDEHRNKIETVYMIGDSNVDIQTAKNAELYSIGCAWGFRGRDELVTAGADFIAETPADIPSIILG